VSVPNETVEGKYNILRTPYLREMIFDEDMVDVRNLSMYQLMKMAARAKLKLLVKNIGIHDRGEKG
jgi:hypothetical protein